MAQFMIVQINCDHLNDLTGLDGRQDDVTVGSALVQVCRNPHNGRTVLSEQGLDRVLNIIGVTGDPLRADDIKKYWLWKPTE